MTTKETSAATTAACEIKMAPSLDVGVEGRALRPDRKGGHQKRLRIASPAKETPSSAIAIMSLPSALRGLGTSAAWRTTLATYMRGQTIAVPDLLRIYTSGTSPSHPLTTPSSPPLLYPSSLSPPVSRSPTPSPSPSPSQPHPSFTPSAALHASLNSWIATHITSDTYAKKLRAANLAQCTTNFWPRASLTRQSVLGAYLAWFFTWDDEIDYESLKGNAAGIAAYGEASITFIQRRLEQDGVASVDAVVTSEEQKKVEEKGDDIVLQNCSTWTSIALTLSQGQSSAHLTRFAAAVYAYMNAVCAVPPTSTIPPSVEAYMARRLATIGAKPIVLLHPWAYSLQIPDWIWDLDAMAHMLDAVAAGIGLVNDIASLAKELKNGEMENVVALLMVHEECGAQVAVDKVVRMVETAWAEFGAAGQEVMDKVERKEETGQVQRDVKMFVEACREVLVGNVEYHLCAPRYTKGMVFEEDGWGYRLTL